MGKDKIRYLLFKDGRWIWRPTSAMRRAGFHTIKLGPGLVIDGERFPSPEDAARATELNQDWDRHRRGLPPVSLRAKYPPGSVGDGYEIRSIRRTTPALPGTGLRGCGDDSATSPFFSLTPTTVVNAASSPVRWPGAPSPPQLYRPAAPSPTTTKGAQKAGCASSSEPWSMSASIERRNASARPTFVSPVIWRTPPVISLTVASE